MHLRKYPLLLLVFLLSKDLMTQSLPPVGGWREHLPFNNALHADIRGQKILCATPYGYFSYDKNEKSFSRMTKVNGLNEVRVRTMAVEPAGSRVALVYQNGNVDIIDGNRVRNLPDLMVSRVSGDRTVNAALWRGSELLLSTGLGIVVMDPDRREIKDTYRPSANGSSIAVSSLAWKDGFYYAATSEGIKQAPASGVNLADHRSWKPFGSSGLTTGVPVRLAASANALVLSKNDSVWLWKPQGWDLIQSGGGAVTGLDATSEQILISQSSRVTALDPVNGSMILRLQHPDISLPRQAVKDGNDYWIADQYNGLLRINANRSERVFPNSPINTSAGDLLVFNHEVWAAAGAVNEAWNYTYNPNGLYRFREGVWENINLYVRPELDSLLDLIALAGEPISGTVTAGSFGGGMMDIAKDGKIKIYKQQTGLQEAIGDPRSYRVGGLAYDRDGNLWIANYGAPQNLVLRKKDGSWKRFTIPFLHTENAVSQISIDEEGRKWIVSPKGNGVFCLDDGNSIDNTSDDRWRFFRQGKGNGNLPSSEVRCLAIDKDGFVWIGTAKGIAIVQCTDELFSSSCEAYLPVVQTDNFAGYLFANEDVRCMAVDGANRKWIGTKNGVWLMDAEGSKVIHHFNESNSPLLSNLIHRIAIEPKTGEVFISTFNGICSFRGAATEAVQQTSDVLVFPNPVPPGYTGQIAIRGLVENAVVKITEVDGRLVYQTRALGGQAVWNGRNYKGEKASSGAYLVFVIDDTGKGKLASKVFIVR